MCLLSVCRSRAILKKLPLEQPFSIVGLLLLLTIIGTNTRQVNASELASKRPNILFYLVDDMGWMDSSVYGSRYYDTPNMERLARRGMIFSNAYSASPLCSATRASLMTGRYPAGLAITGASGHLPPMPDMPLLAKRAAPGMKVVCPRSRRYLPLDQYTIAEAFHDAGYKTGFIGKWHLGFEPWWPEKQGFDVNIAAGHYPGPPSYFSPYHIKTLKDGPAGEYLTDRLTDETLQYLEENHDKPFFLCLWHYAVHAPFQAKKEVVDQYRSKEDPSGNQDCPTMAAMIKSEDESLGRIMDKLDELGIADNTIIIFTSDNGGNMYDRVEGTTPTNNAPFRGGKATLHEGGTREPCIVVWSDAVEPGSQSEEVITSIDFYPTLLEMAGIEPNPKQRVDGLSIVPVLKQTGGLQRNKIFCHFPHYILATDNIPGTYVRQGDWKLIRRYGEGPNRSHGYELYNLNDDLSEQNNLADAMPEKVRELDALITAHLEETGALVPIDNPDFGRQPPPRPPKKTIAGWLPSDSCILEAAKGTLRVKCTGGDPYFHTPHVPATSGAVVVCVRIKSSGFGSGQFFWGVAQQPNFASTRRSLFDITNDGTWHEYEVKLPLSGPLRSLRLDLEGASGTFEFDWIRLKSPSGKTLKAWEF